MRKNDLIAKLQAIKGNPEVLLWNGLVSDYQHLAEPTEGDLVKVTEEHYLEMCRLENAIDAKDWNLQLSEKEVQELKKIYRTFKYEHNNYVTQEDVKAKRYRKKMVLYISAKPRGETSYGRACNLYY